MIRTHNWRRTLAVIVITGIILSGWDAHASRRIDAVPRMKDKWIRLTTEHFTLFSNADKHRSVEIARSLELLHDVLSATSGLDLTSPLPTSVYIFKNESWFAHYDSYDTDDLMRAYGYFVGSAAKNYIAVDISAEVRYLSTVYHEYIHSVMRSSVPGAPDWFEEGLAELYSSFEVIGRTAYIGLPVATYRWRLRGAELIPLDELLRTRLEDVRATDNAEGQISTGSGDMVIDHDLIFYQQAWALTHYLVVDRPTYRDRLHSYVVEVQNGADPARSLASALGVELTELQQEFEAFLEADEYDVYRYTFAESFEESPVQIDRMGYTETLLRLGELLATDMPFGLEKARNHANAALAIDDKLPEAYLILAQVRLYEEEPAEAVALCEKALSLDQTSPEIYALLGTSLWEQELYREDDEDSVAPDFVSPLLARAREMFRRSLELKGESASILALLGETYTLAGEHEDLSEGVRSLARAVQLVPSNGYYLGDLIALTARSGNLEGARNLLVRSLWPRGTPDQIQYAEYALSLSGVKAASRSFQAGQYYQGETLLRQAMADARDPVTRAKTFSWLFLLGMSTVPQRHSERYKEARAATTEGKYLEAANILNELGEDTSRQPFRVIAAVQEEALRMTWRQEVKQLLDQASRLALDENHEACRKVLSQIDLGDLDQDLRQQALAIKRSVDTSQHGTVPEERK